MTKLASYIKASFLEMKKVTWPSKKETVTYTVLVINISLAVAAFLGSLDFIFQKGLEIFFLS
jgi:preprotein translocase subunit SecE